MGKGQEVNRFSQKLSPETVVVEVFRKDLQGGRGYTCPGERDPWT